LLPTLLLVQKLRLYRINGIHQNEGMSPPLKAWVEETALLFEGLGLPRMAGRVLAWLLVADPPEQTLKEMGEALG
jgi:DNA-binding transcriptional regulator GbsR (MarR family)